MVLQPMTDKNNLQVRISHMVDMMAPARVPSRVSVSIDHIAKPPRPCCLMKLPLASVSGIS